MIIVIIMIITVITLIDNNIQLLCYIYIYIEETTPMCPHILSYTHIYDFSLNLDDGRPIFGSPHGPHGPHCPELPSECFCVQMS